MARNNPPRVLFRPKGRVAVLTDAQWTALNPAARPDTPIGDAYKVQAQMKGTDYSMPRYVAGEHKAIKAEGFWATALHTAKMVKAELKK